MYAPCRLPRRFRPIEGHWNARHTPGDLWHHQRGEYDRQVPYRYLVATAFIFGLFIDILDSTIVNAGSRRPPGGRTMRPARRSRATGPA
jgi:hypothetical protein